MFKYLFLFFIFLNAVLNSAAQRQTREELEKQRQQLKKEIDQTEKLLNNNKAQTKENLLQWKLITNKVSLQDRIIENISKDINMLDDNMYSIQKDINRYDKLLDTLKQEYAKSMVYSYKNRSNYDFLSFIFSAANFNDAIKRIAYLKSYRNYREIQGENILRTQEMRRRRIEDLSGTKQKKNVTLKTQSNEMIALEEQQKEKDRILAELKKRGKQLNGEIAAKQKQMRKVNNAIAAAIKAALEEARRAALAKAAEEERKRVATEKAFAKANPGVKPATSSKTKIIPKKLESVLLNSENIALNTSFERNRGSLPWPLDRGMVLMPYGMNKLPSGSNILNSGITISSEIGTPVKAVFDGTVSWITAVEDMLVVTIQHGRYFTTYSNLNGLSVKKGQEVRTGQVIGKVASNWDGIGTMDFILSNEHNNYDPEKWLHSR